MTRQNSQLNGLPVPPAGKHGWPWEDVPLLEPRALPADDWPLISIVIPHCNYADYIEGAIRSVILQNYPKLELIVIDDGSADASLEMIRKYEPWIDQLIVRENKGQTATINEGFALANGEIVNWLCSDDRLAPGALITVGRLFAQEPRIDIIAGRGHNIHVDKGNWIFDFKPRALDATPAMYPVAQPACFYRRNLLRRPKALDESYHYVMDLELWAYFRARQYQWKIINDVLSFAYVGHRNKTSNGGVAITHELERVYTSYVRERVPLTYWHRKFRFPLEQLRAKSKNKLWRGILAGCWVGVTLFLMPFYGFKRAWMMRWQWVL